MKGLVSVLCLSAFLATGCAATAREVKIQQTQPKQKIEEKIIQEEQQVEEKTDLHAIRISNDLKLDYKMYVEIFLEQHFAARACDDDSCYDNTYLNAIRRYKEFLKLFPSSDLADEAKLRIAEFYDLASIIEEIVIIDGNNFTFKTLRGPQDKNMLVYLDDIIDNHVQADHYAIRLLETNKEPTPDDFYLDTNPANSEKTAAIALYWKATWFRSNKKQAKECLERIIKEYPNSKNTYRDAQEELKKY